MTDDRNYIDRARSLAEKLTGETREQVDAELPIKFALHGLERRAQILDEIDRTMPNGEIDELDHAQVRDEFDKLQLRHRLYEIHETLRKAGR